MLNLKAFSATFDSVSSRVLSLESLFVCFQKKIIKNKKLEAELPDWQVSGQLNSNYCGNLLHNPAVIFAQCSLSLSVSVSGRNLGIQPREKLIQAFNTTGSKTMNHNGIFPKLTSFLSKKKKKISQTAIILSANFCGNFQFNGNRSDFFIILLGQWHFYCIFLCCAIRGSAKLSSCFFNHPHSYCVA